MAKSTTYKSVVVKEDPKTSLAEAGINPLTLANGMRVVVIAHAFFPNHDRSLYQLLLQYLRDTRPEVVIMQGGMLDEDAFKALCEEEDNYLHDFPEAPEVASARLAGGFEAQIMALGKSCGDFIKSFAEASGGQVIYIPSATHLSLPNEVRLMEAIQRHKAALDSWSENHCDIGALAQKLAEELLATFAPEVATVADDDDGGEDEDPKPSPQVKALAKILQAIGLKGLLERDGQVGDTIASMLKDEGLELPSDPTLDLPNKLAAILQINDLPNITVLRYGASVKINNKWLFMIGDFRRRNAGDSSRVEWEQRGGNIVRSFDGKVSSAWMTTPDNTLTGLVLKQHEFHEVGYLWDATRMGHLRDYDRRAPGFWAGEVVEGELFGESVIIMRGNDNRRSFVVDLPAGTGGWQGGFKAYTEDTPGALPNGSELTLAPRTPPGGALAEPASATAITEPAPATATTEPASATATMEPVPATAKGKPAAIAKKKPLKKKRSPAKKSGPSRRSKRS